MLMPLTCFGLCDNEFEKTRKRRKIDFDEWTLNNNKHEISTVIWVFKILLMTKALWELK